MNDNWNNTPMGNEEKEQYIFNPEEKAKRRPKKGLIIGIVVVVLALVLALVLIICNAVSSSKSSESSEFSKSSGFLDDEEEEKVEVEPLELVGIGFGNSVSALGKDSAVSLLGDMVNGGSMEVSIDLETLMNMTMGYPMGKGTASVKLYTDVEEQRAALEAQAKMQGITFDAGAYLSEDAIAVVSEELFGKGAYGIKLDDMIKNFPSSEFGPNGAYSLGIELPAAYQIDQKQQEKLTESTTTMALSLGKQIVKSVKANADISKEDDTLSFDSDEIDVTAVIIEMDAEQVVDFAGEMLEHISEDDDFRAFLETFLGIAAESSGVSSYEVEAIIDSFYEEIEYAKEQLEDPEGMEDLEEASLEIVFYVTKSDQQLVGVDFALENDDEEETISIIAGPDWADLSEISVYVNSYGEEIGFSYIVEEDNKEFSAKMKATEGREVVAEAKLEWDKKNGDFKLEISDGYDVVYAIGTMTDSGKKFEIFLQEIGMEGEETIELNTTITFSASDSMPAMPKYKDILTMSAEELEPLMEVFQGWGAVPYEELESDYTYYYN